MNATDAVRHFKRGKLVIAETIFGTRTLVKSVEKSLKDGYVFFGIEGAVLADNVKDFYIFDDVKEALDFIKI